MIPRLCSPWILVVVGLLILAAAPSTASAQKQSIGANMVTNFSGKLVSFKRGTLIVTRDDGTEMTVALPDSATDFNFIAKAKPPYLQRGMLIRFKGTFNQAGQAQGEIKKVEIFQPPAGKLRGHQREMYAPGIYPVERLDDGQPPPQVAEVRVVGGIVGFDPSGVMSVMVGRQTLQVPVANDAQFEIRLNNMTLAKEGDPVKVDGFYQEGAETKVKASRITIQPNRVYGEPGEGSGKKSRRVGKRTRKSAKTEDAPSELKP